MFRTDAQPVPRCATRHPVAQPETIVKPGKKEGSNYNSCGEFGYPSNGRGVHVAETPSRATDIPRSMMWVEPESIQLVGHKSSIFITRVPTDVIALQTNNVILLQLQP